ncbi:unnamed protein product [Didymodactylos carnosus]|uniref:TRPM SLOG domain-containing protein n=1 Tax=Didymodactylos carnosus TaxID=1234261 RepID=A0A815C3F6_9BILA|nr:unnamed protein product [Didymodactylos carnosus]CAF1279956.1 unnamed protein product [Didymodactylos carnosus]CAF3791613.1 unnamed protein product [Didymodactylos carnosus]CAF4074520.1 unnamed protein product [Didymodactylos carnosus]
MVSTSKWLSTVETFIASSELTGVTCNVYNTQSQAPANDLNAICGCKRYIRNHSYTDNVETPPKDKWNLLNNAVYVPVTYGIRKNQSKFIRCVTRQPEDIISLYDFIKLDCQEPNLIVSCYGGAKYFTMNKDLEKEFMIGIAHVATTKGYGVTIIVEGGLHTSEVIDNDLQHRRPVVIIQGSGRMADVIANLLDLTTRNEQTSPSARPSDDEIKRELKRMFPVWPHTSVFSKPEDILPIMNSIMNPSLRIYLNIYHLNGNTTLTETIFNAVFRAKFADKDKKQQAQRSTTDQQISVDDETTVDRKLLNLAIKWNCIYGAKEILEEKQDIYKDKLFLQVTPSFQSPMQETTFDIRVKYALGLILGLYGAVLNEEHETDRRRVLRVPKSIDDLDVEYRRWIGPFLFSLYSKKTWSQRLKQDCSRVVSKTKRHLCACMHIDDVRDNKITSESDKTVLQTVNRTPTDGAQSVRSLMVRPGEAAYATFFKMPNCKYGEQEMLRDLYLWAILMNRVKIAKVLLLHIKPRICAALIGSIILNRYSNHCIKTDEKNMYRQQALELEIYATECINACYRNSERKACELLLREIPLFGNVTCMQVAIANRSHYEEKTAASEASGNVTIDNNSVGRRNGLGKNFVNTDCFDQALRRIWYNKLDNSNQNYSAKPKILFCLLTLGLAAPWLISYRPKNDIKNEFGEIELAKK